MLACFLPSLLGACLPPPPFAIQTLSSFPDPSTCQLCPLSCLHSSAAPGFHPLLPPPFPVPQGVSFLPFPLADLCPNPNSILVVPCLCSSVLCFPSFLPVFQCSSALLHSSLFPLSLLSLVSYSPSRTCCRVFLLLLCLCTSDGSDP